MMSFVAAFATSTRGEQPLTKPTLAPQVVSAKLDASKIPMKLIVMKPFHRDGRPSGMRPKFLSVDDIKIYDRNGIPVELSAAQRKLEKLTSVFVISGFDGSLERSRLLTEVGPVAVRS